MAREALPQTVGLSRVQTRRSKSIALDVTPVCTYTVFSPSPHRTPTPDNNDSPTHPAPGFGIQFSVLCDRPRGVMYIRPRGPLSGYLDSEWGPPAAGPTSQDTIGICYIAYCMERNVYMSDRELRAVVSGTVRPGAVRVYPIRTPGRKGPAGVGRTRTRRPPWRQFRSLE